MRGHAFAAATALLVAAAPAMAQEETLNRDDVRDILQEQGYTDIGLIRQYFTARVQDPEGERVTLLVDGRTGLVRDAETGRITEAQAVRILEESGLQDVANVRWREEAEAYRLDAERNGEEILVEVHGFTGQVRQVLGEEARGQDNAGDGNGEQAEIPGGIGRTERAFD